jgi:DNA-binding Xre family transcriptional regulator
MESKPGSSGGKILFWVTGLIWTHLFLLQLDHRWLSFLYPDCSLIYRLSLKDGLCFVRVSFIIPPQCEIDKIIIFGSSKPCQPVDFHRLQVEQGLTKTEMASQMNTSRASLNRLLDPASSSVTLQTLENAAHALNKRLRIEFA